MIAKLHFAYLDHVTVCGKTRKKHDFLNAAKDCNLSLNESKCVFATESINLLGYNVSHGILQRDLRRVKPVLDLPLPKSSKNCISDFVLSRATLFHLIRVIIIFCLFL